MNLAQWAMTENYLHVERLIDQLTWKFVRQYGGDFEELQSRAREWFCDTIMRNYNPHKAKLTTYTQIRIWNEFKSLARSCAVRNNKLHQKTTDLELIQQKPRFDAESFAAELSEDARYIVELLFDKTSVKNHNAIDWSTAQKIGWCLEDSLKKLGWTAVRISESFKEIKDALI